MASFDHAGVKRPFMQNPVQARSLDEVPEGVWRKAIGWGSRCAGLLMRDHAGLTGMWTGISFFNSHLPALHRR